MPWRAKVHTVVHPDAHEIADIQRGSAQLKPPTNKQRVSHQLKQVVVLPTVIPHSSVWI